MCSVAQTCPVAAGSPSRLALVSTVAFTMLIVHAAVDRIMERCLRWVLLVDFLVSFRSMLAKPVIKKP